LGNACIVPAPSGEKSTTEKKRMSSTAAPPLTLTIGANLGGKVEISSVSIQPGQISPGEQARVTILFKVLDKLDKDYVVFVHVEDADGRLERMNLDHRPAGGAYPTTQWKKGETIRDDFVLYLPPGAQIRGLNIWLGLWEPVSDTRLPLKNPEAVRNDGKDRILVARVPVAAG
jgi:hypothetical protein